MVSYGTGAQKKPFLEHLSFISHAALAVAGSPWPLDVLYYLNTYPPTKVTKRGTN
jgi:hypothetical protein